MWFIYLLLGIMALITAMTVITAINYKNYPITDEYWIAGIILLAFIGTIIAMVLS